jgi:glycosyltransferase involved in cell wall biosynthesis
LAYATSQYMALLRAQRIIAISKYTASQIRRFAPFVSRKIDVVLNGIEHRFAPVESELTAKYLLYVGGFSLRKNVSCVLQAYDLLVTRSATVLPLCLTGREEDLDAEAATTLIKLSSRTRSHIRFLGFVQDDDMPALYHSAEALLFPSLAEGFGYPPLEAMACGTPVIASAADSIPEVVGNSALLIDPITPSELADAVSRLLGNAALRRSLVLRGLRRADELRWDRCARLTLGVYKRALRIADSPNADSAA